MKNIIIILVFVHFQLNAQQVHTGLEINYDPCTGTCSSSNTNYGATENLNNPSYYASDFGPRDLSSIGRAAYDWHQGVDISPASGDTDIGYYLRAIVGGTVLDIRGGGGLKYIVIDGENHDFGYGHLFWNLNSRDQSGGCHLKKMLSPNQNRYAIIIIADGDTSIIDPQAGSVIFAGDTLTVRDSITAGEPISPTGGSVDGGNLGPHLHLHSNPGGSTSVNDEIPHNPLQYVNYVDTTVFGSVRLEYDAFRNSSH